MENIRSDTDMRKSIAKEDEGPSTTGQE